MCINEFVICKDDRVEMRNRVYWVFSWVCIVPIGNSYIESVARGIVRDIDEDKSG